MNGATAYIIAQADGDDLIEAAAADAKPDKLERLFGLIAVEAGVQDKMLAWMIGKLGRELREENARLRARIAAVETMTAPRLVADGNRQGDR